MTEARWQIALRAHREAHGVPADRDHTRLMFVACSESAAATSLLATFPTAYVLQTIMGLPLDLDTGARATLEYGVVAQGVLHVVVCGHQRCRGDGDAQTAEASQAVLAARCRALVGDAQLGPILRRAHVTMRALWFEEASRDVYGRRLTMAHGHQVGDERGPGRPHAAQSQSVTIIRRAGACEDRTSACAGDASPRGSARRCCRDSVRRVRCHNV
jgi:hypothetical protein